MSENAENKETLENIPFKKELKEENNKIIEFIMSYLTQWSEVKA